MLFSNLVRKSALDSSHTGW